MTFIDVCAGIGGGRLGLEANGLKCVAYSEIDPNPAKTYRHFYGNDEKNWGDLMKIDTQLLPDFDVLIGGFPCQTFSILGKRAGFDDNRGLVIYGICKILKEKNVPCFILENVKGLVNHDGGKTLKIIIHELKELGYEVDYRVLNSSDFGVPQMRERIYIVGTKNAKNKFIFPKKQPKAQIKDFLIETNEKYVFSENDPTFQKYLNNKYNAGKFKIEKLLAEDFLVIDTRQSDLRPYRGICPTLRTGRHGILYVRDGKLRKLSAFESLLLQGFPVEIAEKIKKSNLVESALLSQAGNAMTVNVIAALGKNLLECYK